MAGVTHESRHAPALDEALLVRHLPIDGWRFWAVFLFLGAGTLPLLFAFLRQLQEGHAVTGQGSHGAIWGVIVANIINFIGISHVGIAISAVVRILRLERYRQLARIAELITLAAITTAVLNIAMDVGHPERFIINVVWFGRYHSPFVWSATVITTYVIGSSVYLYLAMRRDLWMCTKRVPSRRLVYTVAALGYQDTPESRARHTRVVWWLAVVILPIMVSVHSVYGYIFGMQAGRPGWYNPFQAPYFVLGAIVSGFSTVIVALAILRKAFGWEQVFPPRLFKGLGIFLGFVTLLYMYFLFSEYLTGMYASPEGERMVFTDILFGSFAPITWTCLLGGMLFPFALLFIQGVNRRIVSIPLTVFAALLINLSVWGARSLIVVPSFYHPLLPWEVADYRPTLSEWSMVASSFYVFGLLLLVLIKALPVLEFDEPHDGEVRVASMPWWKRMLVGGSVAMGVSLIVFGISHRHQPELFHPAAIWITGIVTLLSVPFQICVVPERMFWRRRRPLGARVVAAAEPASVGRYSATASRWAAKAPCLGPEHAVRLSALQRTHPSRTDRAPA